MSKEFEITREIGIDAGHRVTYHGSKCRNLHGHRYTIQATCAGPLFPSGEQEGMVLDFGFLKDEMMRRIDVPCDHGMILWWKDPLLSSLIPGLSPAMCDQSRAAEAVGVCGKLYIVPFVPTAEHLAKHWFEVLAPEIVIRSEDRARLKRVRVLETPNCWADYPAI